MHDQNGNFGRRSEIVRINANARKTNKQTNKQASKQTIITEMKNAFDGRISRSVTTEK